MNKIVESTHQDQAVIVAAGPRCTDGSSIEELMTAFLKKIFSVGESASTLKKYATVLPAFRDYLIKEHQLDLLPLLDLHDPDALMQIEMFRNTVSDALIDFAIVRKDKKGFLSKRERNVRISVITSFYEYALTHKKISNLVGNPALLVERSKIERASSARIIELDELVTRLHALLSLSEKSLADERDLAILLVLLFTGSRADAVCQMRYGDLDIGQDTSGRPTVKIFFAHMKRGKQKYVDLQPGIAAILVSYLQRAYGSDYHTLKKDAAVWIALAATRNPGMQKKWEQLGRPRYLPLEYKGLRGICEHRLGTSRVHTTRYTASAIIKALGMTLEERQQFFDHSSADTTLLYDQVAERGKIRVAVDLEQFLLNGILPQRKS